MEHGARTDPGRRRRARPAVDGGAYVAKPVGREELVARVEALLRRARSSGPSEADVHRDRFLTLDLRQRLVQVRGTEVALTPLEFRMLSTFVRHAGTVLDRDQLRALVWNDTQSLAPPTS